jgi:hypothetical protein
MQHKVLKFSIFFKIFLYTLNSSILHVYKNRKKEKEREEDENWGMGRSDLTV